MCEDQKRGNGVGVKCTNLQFSFDTELTYLECVSLA